MTKFSHSKNVFQVNVLDKNFVFLVKTVPVISIYFQALGNLYFIHECVEEVMIYDFIGKYYIERKH